MSLTVRQSVTVHPARRAQAILLAGGSGFVGSAIGAELVARGHHVRAISREPGKLAWANAQVEELAGEFFRPEVAQRAARGCLIVINAAGTSGPLMREVNVGGTEALLDAARKEGVRQFVQISSLAAYERAGQSYIDESGPLKCEGDAYGLSKADADRRVFDAAREGLLTTVLRPGAVLGVHPTSYWSVQLLHRLVRGEVQLRGDGRESLPVVHGRDLARAVMLVVERAAADNEVFNLADEHTTFRTLIDAYCRFLGVGTPRGIPLSKLPPGTYFNGTFAADSIATKMSYKASMSLADALAESENYWRVSVQGVDMVIPRHSR